MVRGERVGKRYFGDKEYASIKFIVGEVPSTKRRYLKMLDHKNWVWTFKMKEATLFSSHKAAEDVIKVVFEDDDFNLNIFKVQKSNSRFTFINSTKEDNLRNIIEIDNDDLVEEDIEQILWSKGKIDFKTMTSDFIINNQKHLRSLIIIKIGQLIDFHNKCNKPFSDGNYNNKDNKEDDCGCLICQKINYFVDFLDLPEMSKKVLCAEEIKDAFYYFLSMENVSLQNISERQIPMLAKCFENYKKWKIIGFTNVEIAQRLGVGKSTVSIWIKTLKNNGYENIC